jgi:hypothetical protein
MSVGPITCAPRGAAIFARRKTPLASGDSTVG